MIESSQMTEASAKAIKEADVWVVPYFLPFFTVDDATVKKVLGNVRQPVSIVNKTVRARVSSL